MNENELSIAKETTLSFFSKIKSETGNFVTKIQVNLRAFPFISDDMLESQKFSHMIDKDDCVPLEGFIDLLSKYYQIELKSKEYIENARNEIFNLFNCFEDKVTAKVLPEAQETAIKCSQYCLDDLLGFVLGDEKFPISQFFHGIMNGFEYEELQNLPKICRILSKKRGAKKPIDIYELLNLKLVSIDFDEENICQEINEAIQSIIRFLEAKKRSEPVYLTHSTFTCDELIDNLKNEKLMSIIIDGEKFKRSWSQIRRMLQMKKCFKDNQDKLSPLISCIILKLKNKHFRYQGIFSLLEFLSQFTSAKLCISYRGHGMNDKLFEKMLAKLLESKLMHSEKSMKSAEFLFSDDNNKITDKGIIKLRNFLNSTPNLLKLTFCFSGGLNSVTNKGLNELAHALSGIRCLQNLHISIRNLNSGGNNSITDEGFTHLCSSLAHLKYLKNLILDFGGVNCRISDDGFKIFSQTFSKDLTSLELNLGWNSISDEGLIDFTKNLSLANKVSNLSLNFTYNNISDEGLIATIDSIQSLATTLRSLELNFAYQKNTKGNKGISEKGLDRIASILYYLKSLKKIRLFFMGNAKITENAYKNLSKSIAELKHLNTIELDFEFASLSCQNDELLVCGTCQLSCIMQAALQQTTLKKIRINVEKATQAVGINLLKQFLKINSSTLEELKINCSSGLNHINDATILSFCEELDSAHKLSTLSLELSGGVNQITDAGLIGICKTISNKKNLLSLKLDFSQGKNGITDVGMKAIGEALRNKNELNYFQLNFSWGENEITDDGIVYLKPVLKGAENINHLFLNFGNGCGQGKNRITDKGFETLGEYLCHSNSLTYVAIYAYGNRITQKGKNFIRSLAEKPGNKVDVHV